MIISLCAKKNKMNCGSFAKSFSYLDKISFFYSLVNNLDGSIRFQPFPKASEQKKLRCSFCRNEMQLVMSQQEHFKSKKLLNLQNEPLDWTSGLDLWTGPLDWSSGLDFFRKLITTVCDKCDPYPQPISTAIPEAQSSPFFLLLLLPSSQSESKEFDRMKH